MIINLYQYGEMLISRPSGREAYFFARAYLLSEKIDKIDFDFDKVKVLTPGWIDEFISHLKKDYPGIKINFLHSDNPSVISSLKMISPSSS